MYGCKEACMHWTNWYELSETKSTHINLFHCCFHYNHLFDEHNNLNHSLPSDENIWRTDHLAVWVFPFVFSFRVNVFLLLWYFVWDNMKTQTNLNFHHNLHWEIINNPMLDGEIEETTQKVLILGKIHKFVIASNHVKHWDTQEQKRIKYPYQHLTCKCTSKNFELHLCHWRVDVHL